MKRIAVFTLTLFIALTVSAVLRPEFGSQPQAQSNCEPFEAIAQAVLPSSTQLAPQTGIFDVWGGPLSGMVGSEYIQGVLSGNDGPRSPHPAIGQARGGFYTVGLDCTVEGGTASCKDTFTYEVPTSVFTPPPGFGQYIGNTARIVRGTGRFEFASGNLNVRGPFVAWPDANSPFGLSGRWNPELTGHICGVH